MTVEVFDTKVVLGHRHLGLTYFVKELAIPVCFSDTVKLLKSQTEIDFIIKEEKLIAAIASRSISFLPCIPNQILLLVADADGNATAVSKPRMFKKWGKYFDAYTITVEKLP